MAEMIRCFDSKDALSEFNKPDRDWDNTQLEKEEHFDLTENVISLVEKEETE